MLLLPLSATMSVHCWHVVCIAIALLALAGKAIAVNNGLARVPQMGWVLIFLLHQTSQLLR